MRCRDRPDFSFVSCASSEGITHAGLLTILTYCARPCRHGESEHNTSSDWGIRDPGLTEKGWKQVSRASRGRSACVACTV